VVALGGIFKRTIKLYGLPRNPVDIVERPRVRRGAKIDVLRPKEILALVRAAEEGRHRKEPEGPLGPRGKAVLRGQDEMDAAIFHVAAFAGLRMGEILALRWRDIDFARRTIHVRENWTQGATTTPKSGSERAVPMADEVAKRLARIGQPEHKSLKDRYKGALEAAELRVDFRFHNLRHTFGSTVIRHADSREVMEWMGDPRPHDYSRLSGLRRPRGRGQAGL
jgi:integrase